MTDYVVLYERAEEGGWGAYLPDVPGVIALGETRAEVERRMREAIRAYAEIAHEEGRSLPAALHEADVLRVKEPVI